MSDIEFLKETNTQDIIKYIMEDLGDDIVEAMDRFYSSVTYEKLMDEKTGLYRESPAYIYEILKDEIVAGEFVQNEI